MANRRLIETPAGSVGAFIPPLYDGKTPLTPDQLRVITDYLVDLAAAINGNLSFGTGDSSTRGGNLNSQWVSQVFAVANVEYEIPHGLGRRPVDVWFGVPSAACNFYTANRGSWGISSIWLACDAANITVPILIF